MRWSADRTGRAACSTSIAVSVCEGMDTATATHGQASTSMTPEVRVTSDFESTYRAEYPALIAVARAWTGDLRDSEDLVQDTMLKAFVRWPTVGRLDRPGGWCHRVLLRACHSLFRRKGVEGRWRRRQHPDEPLVPGPSADVEAFWMLVRQLPERPRAVVVLHFAGGYDLTEIAEILGSPSGTIRSDWTRARSVLAAQLGAR